MPRKPTVFKDCSCPNQEKCREHSWRYRYTKPAGGRSVASVPSEKRTRAQAQAWLDDQLDAGITAPTPKAPRKTFAEHAEEWLTYHCPASPVSRYRYRRSLERFTYPEWGSRRLESITRAEVSRWARQLERDRVNPYHWDRFVSVMLDAQRAGLTQADVLLRITSPADPAVARTYTFSDTDYERFVDALAPHYRAVAIGAHDTGMRKGELLGLCTDDINWETGWITVRRQVINSLETGYRTMVVNRLKTSRRTGGVSVKQVPLSDAFRRALEGHMQAFPPIPAQATVWEWTGRDLREMPTQPVSVIFSTKNGSLVDPGHFGALVKRTSEKLGLYDEEGRTVVFHAFRHTFASLALQEGVPPSTVAMWIGDRLSQLERTYAHLIRDLSHAAVSRLQDRLAQSSPGTVA